MKTVYALGLLFLSFQTGTFRQEKFLTKDDAIALALENNFEIKVAKIQIAIAGNNQSILNSGYLPTLNGVVNAAYNRDDSTIEFPGQVNDTGIPRADVIIDKAEAQRYNSSLKLNYLLFVV